MSNVKLNERSFNRCIEEIDEKQRKAFIEKMEKEKIIPTLPNNMWDSYFGEYDKEITAIIKREIAKLKYKSGKRMIKSNEIYRSMHAQWIPFSGYGNEDNTYKYDITGDSHKGYLYTVRNIVERKRAISYWFGKVPGWDESGGLKSMQRNRAFPMYISDGSFPMYQPSKYPEKYKEYVYMPYIANTQPPAKDYVYWTDKTTGKRRRSTGDRKGNTGMVDRTWHNKKDKGFVQKIVKKINRKLQTRRNYIGKARAIRELNNQKRIRQNVDLEYWVKIAAKVGDGFKKE